MTLIESNNVFILESFLQSWCFGLTAMMLVDTTAALPSE